VEPASARQVWRGVTEENSKYALKPYVSRKEERMMHRAVRLGAELHNL